MKKLMYIVFFLLMAANLLAQETYVIDSVCVGAQRTYAHDGEEGYTFAWEIVDRQLGDTMYVTGSDFMDINGTDTTWGNEIEHLWDAEGEYDIIVYVTTEHGCDTLEQGMVKVFELPGVYAGPDLVLCSQLADMVVSGDTAWNYSALYWETLGDGTIVGDGSLHPTYNFGPNDIDIGQVTLILKADGFAGNGTCDPAIDSVTYYFSEPDISFDPHDPICYNDSNGYIKATITGGLAPFTYEWEGPPGFVSVDADSIAGLWAGTYILTVTDANLCVDIDTIELFNPPELIISIDSVRDVSCYGYADGFIWASATGGTGLLSYEWIGPNAYTASEDSILNLSGGEYILHVYDEYGCETYDTVIVDEPDPLIAVIDSAMDVQCYGFANGYAHVTVTDGTGPYTYSWNSDPVQDSAWALNLGPGWYTATITDLNGCMAWDSVYIDEPEPLLVTADSIDVRCDGDKPGEIHLEVTGGNQLANAPFYYFEWYNEADSLIATTKDIYGLAGDQYYTVYVSDSLGCADTLSVYVNEIPMMQMEVSIDSALCYGDLWSIDLTITEGRPAYLFEWTDTAGTVLSTSEDMFDIPAGTYNVTVIDADSCILTEQFILLEPPLIKVNITASDSILCVGEEAFIFGNPEGGTGAITQSWTGYGANFLSATDKANVVFGYSGPGSFDMTYTIIDENGCDATDDFHIDVYPPDFVYDSMEICAYSDPFTWNDKTVTSEMDRVYKDTLVNQYGCDSVITLNVTVLFPEIYDTTIYVCENEAPFQPYGNITVLPDRDSIYLDTVRYTESGCDSLLITINVFTLPVTESFHDSTLCAGAGEFMWNNRLIQTDSSQVYLDTLVNSFGCDSLLTYDITILPPDTFYVDTTFCQDEPEFVWNGITILTQRDSVYEATLQNQFGCDSIVNLDVHLLPVTDTLLNLTFCAGPGDTTLNNRLITFDESRIYLDTLMNSYGCDSLLTYDVIIVPPDTVNLDTTICEGEPVFAWGVNTVHQVDSYTDSIYTDMLQNRFGCDSIVNLDVRILRPQYLYDTIVVCENEPAFTWYSHTVLTDRDSIYFDTLYYDAGCDSLRLQLEVYTLPVSDTLLDTTLCEGSPEFVWNSHTISTFVDSTYLDTLTNVYGCDSTLTFIVDIVPAFKDTFTDALCYGEPIADWYGQAISNLTDSTYIQLLPDPSGCDTLLYYEVTILPVTDTVLDTTLCAGLPEFMWNNRLISTTADGVYLDTLTNSFGCDSLLTYNVTILPPDTFRMDTILCLGDPEFDWNELTVSTTVEDEYLASLTNADGCDSIVILNVTIINGVTIDTTIYACEEYTWTDGNGLTYTASGDYLHTIGGATGCADSVWLHLIVSPPIDLVADPVDVLCYGDSTGSIDLTVSGGISPFTIEWNTGETTEDLANLPAGIYSVLVTDSIGCSDSLEVEITQPDSILITLDQLTDVLVQGESTGSIEVSVSGGTPTYTYEWTDETGIVVDSVQDLYNQLAGDYTLTVTDANDCVTTFTATITEPVPLDKYMAPVVTPICYEDRNNYPILDSLSEYVTLDSLVEVFSNAGLDLTTFRMDSLVVDGSTYCYEEIRTYSIMDFDGDTLSATHRIIVDDQEIPDIVCPPDYTVSNGIVPQPYDSLEFLAAGGSFTDNCGIVSFELIDEQIDNLTDHILVTRTYEVRDYCGNVNSCEHEIKVYSDVDIALECQNLPKVYFECRDFRPDYRTLQEFWDAGGRYSSSVPIDTFFYKDSAPSKAYCPTITRTYILRNVAGQEVQCTQKFEVLDEEPPVLLLPDKHISCDESWPLYYSYIDVLRYRSSHGNDAFDNCGPNSLGAFSFIRQETIGTCPTEIQRTYGLYDRCGNYTETVESIFVWDTIPPVITNFPTEITAECDVPDAYTDPSLYVQDDCGPITISYRDSLAGPEEPQVVYRTYRFSDPCNYVEVVQRIVIEFTVVPVFDQIGPICQFTTPLALPTTDNNGITGYWLPDSINTDLAGTIDYIFYPDSGQCAGPFSMPIEVRPAIEVYELLHIDQAYNPEPVGEIRVGVFEGTAPFDFLWNTGETVDYIDSLAAGTYTVFVNDAIGCSDTLTIEITSAVPELVCVPDTTIECPDPSQYPAANNILEFEAYGGSYEPLDIVAGFSTFDLPGDRDSCLSIDRYYVVEDIYGRVDTCIQHVDFYDNIPPVIIAPDGDTAECLSTVVPNIETLDEFWAAFGFGAAYDPNCSLDPYTFTRRDTAIILQPGRSQVTVYYSVADFCGNVARDTSVYLITDDEAPEVFCADITVYLDENGHYVLTIQDSITMVDSVYDNCTAPEDLEVVIQVEEITCEDVESGVQATIMVFDEAGLSDECIANINVVDTVPPNALCQDVTVFLDENGEVSITAAMIDAGSFDNCELESIQISNDRFDCTDIGDNVIQLIATDVYGNTDTCESIVTVVDQIAPEITCIVRDTITLSEEDGTYTLTYDMVTTSEWDNCNIVTRELDRYVLDCDDIEASPVTITATAIDQSGNFGICTAEYVVIGNTPPVVQNDTALTAVNVAVDINVILNDYDLKTNINVATLGVVVAPSHGSVVVDNKTGIVTYTPDLDYEGTDIFRYEICDDGIPCVPECGNALVFITVIPANEPPVAIDDYFEVPCHSLTGSVIEPPDDDYDPDGDNIVVNPVPITGPRNGTLVLYDDGHFEYEPFVDFTTGVDSFQYEIWDEPRIDPVLYDTAWVYITRVPDNDCDGVADAIDIDDDNDGIRDNIENGGFWPEDPGAELIDSDQDGIPDYLDIDSDNDGIVDNIEGQDEHNYIEPDGWRDDNNNGWDDRYDNEEGGYPFDLNLTDTDGDGVPDYLDSDSDNDHVLDFIEGNDDNADGIPDYIRFYSDLDRDGLDDAYDWIDGWGIPDLVDNETGSTAPLQDFDGDGWRDWRDVNDEDDEYLTQNEDINGDGDYSNDDLDLDGHPEYLDTELECELFIPEGFSPNDDGVHDFFQILCIYPRYPDAKLMIFNRNGNLLWEKEHYGNFDYWGWNDAWWWGTSDNKLTIGRSGGLPAGNYIYVLLLNDGLGGVRNGTVMIAY